MQKLFLKGEVCLSILFLSVTQVWAQKNAFMLYGSLNYQHTNHDGSQFGANPIGIGYFFNDHVVAGLNYGFDWKKNAQSIKVEDHHELGPFYSDSWMLGDHFVFIAQADTHYVWGNHLNESGLGQNYKGYLARIYPIVSVLLGHGWALKAKFCELSYQSTKDNGADGRRNNTLIAGINGSTIGLGVSKNILFFKK